MNQGFRVLQYAWDPVWPRLSSDPVSEALSCLSWWLSQRLGLVYTFGVALCSLTRAPLVIFSVSERELKPLRFFGRAPAPQPSIFPTAAASHDHIVCGTYKALEARNTGRATPKLRALQDSSWDGEVLALGCS